MDTGFLGRRVGLVLDIRLSPIGNLYMLERRSLVRCRFLKRSTCPALLAGFSAVLCSITVRYATGDKVVRYDTRRLSATCTISA
jgi:hypothetical protein